MLIARAASIIGVTNKRCQRVSLLCEAPTPDIMTSEEGAPKAGFGGGTFCPAQSTIRLLAITADQTAWSLSGAIPKQGYGAMFGQRFRGGRGREIDTDTRKTQNNTAQGVKARTILAVTRQGIVGDLV